VDAFCLHALIGEVRQSLHGTRIARVLQPDRWGLVLVFDRGHGSAALLLSVKPRAPGLHLLSRWGKVSSNPSRASNLLAARMTGARIEAIEQVGLDRIVALHLSSATPAAGDLTLYVEMLGPRGNIVLVDRRSGALVGQLRPRSAESGRPASGPAMRDRPPIDPGRADPMIIGEEAFLALLGPQLANGVAPSRALMKCLTGFGPTMAAELAARGGVSPRAPADDQARALWRSFQDLRARVASGAFEPRLLIGERGQAIGVSAFSLVTVPADRQIPFATMLEAVRAYHANREAVAELETLRAGLCRSLKAAIARAERLRARLHEDSVAYGQADLHARKGQLLLAARAVVHRGVRVVELPDHADPLQRSIRIDLDPARSLEANAERYFTLHRKAKRGAAIVRERLREATDRLKRLERLSALAVQAHAVSELRQIEAELASISRLPAIRRSSGSRRRAVDGPEPRRFCSSDGLPILVGRSGLGNDHLTWRLARPHDLWLHAQGVSGSHVLVRLEKRTGVPPRTLHEAAQIAAYYSRARGQVKVPVDYALRKYLRKPKRAAPGVVLVAREKTIVVTPDAGVVRRLHPGGSDSRREP